MRKQLEVNDQRTIVLNTGSNGVIRNINIFEGFVKKNEVKKSYTLSRDDDFLFVGYIFNGNQNIDELSFDFDESHPLYFSLLRLMGDDDRLIIDDDFTREDNVNYLELVKNDELISMKFANKEDSHGINYEFRIFVKNIMYDLRSKIDQNNLDTKDRLIRFFNEAAHDLSVGYHQIDFDEYEYIKKKELRKD